MNLNKITAFSAAFFLAAASLTGCSKENTTSEVSDIQETPALTESEVSDLPSETEQDISPYKKSDLAKGIVMNIGGKDITEDEYRYFFFYAKEFIDEGDDSYWDDDINGQKLAFLKSQTEDILFKNSTVYRIAEDNSIELDEEDMAAINKTIEEDKIYFDTVKSRKDLKAESFEDYLRETHCTEAVFKESYIRKMLEEKIKRLLFAPPEPDEDEDEYYDDYEDYYDDEYYDEENEYYEDNEDDEADDNTDGNEEISESVNTETEDTEKSENLYDAEYEALCLKTQENMEIIFDTDYDSFTKNLLSK